MRKIFIILTMIGHYQVIRKQQSLKMDLDLIQIFQSFLLLGLILI
jgi:hypothetical protein